MARVLLEFVVDNKGAITEIKKVDKGLGGVDSAAKKTSKGMAGLSTALKAAGAAFAAMGIARFLKGATEAAAEQQRTFVTLANSMKNVGVSYNAVGKELQGTLAALQETTRYGDTDTAAMLNRMINLTGDYGIAMKGLQPIIDMSVSTGQDWKAVSDAVGKAIAGNIGSLSRYGIVLDDATKKMLANATSAERADYLYGLLNERFGGAAQADIQTYAGQMEKLGNYWGDFVETVGTFVTTAPGIGNLFNGLIVAIQSWTEWLIKAGKLMTVAWNTKWIKLFQGELKLLEHKYMMFVARVMDKQKHLPEWMGGGKAATNAGINAVVLAMQAYDEGMDLIADATGDAIEAGDKWEATVRNQITAVTGLAGTPDAAVDEATASLGEFNDELGALLQQGSGTLFAALEAQGGVFNELSDWLDANFEWPEIEFVDMVPPENVPQIEAGFQGLSEEIARIFQNTIADAIYLAFTGRFDEIGDAFQGFFEQISGNAAESISQSLMTGIQGGEVDWGSVGEEALTGMAAGIAAQGIESGNVAQAAIGGAIAGFMTTGNWYGAVAGAVMGAYGALTAPDVTPPSTAITFGVEDGVWTDRFTTRGQDVSNETLQNYSQRAYAAYTEMRQRYYNVLRAFNDPNLFGMVAQGGHTSINTSGTTGTANEVLRTLIETRMPEMFDMLFEEAFRQGLGDLGLSDEAFDALSAELGMLMGEDRLTALETYVGTLIGLTDLAADMDWNAIMEVVGLDAMGQFMLGLEAISEAVDVNMMGLDSMTMLERANQAQSIEQMIADARSAEIAMLRQIDQMQKSILASWTGFNEGIAVGNMSPEQQFSYFKERADEALLNLQGAETIEEVNYWNAELMRYLQAMQGLGFGDQQMGMGFDTWDDWMLEMSAAAREATVTAFDGFRDDIKDANAELILVLLALIEVLKSPGYLIGDDDSVGNEEETGGGSRFGNDDPRFHHKGLGIIPPPNVYVYVYNTGAVSSNVVTLPDAIN